MNLFHPDFGDISEMFKQFANIVANQSVDAEALIGSPGMNDWDNSLVLRYSVLCNVLANTAEEISNQARRGNTDLNI